jgi:hypothetical protein
MHIFTTFLKSKPSNYIHVSDTISVSKLNMSIKEYIFTAEEYCRVKHAMPCKKCLPLITAARAIADRGICPLSHIYREVFSSVKYNNQAAKQRLLQIPVAAIRCGNPESGVSRIYLMERLSDCDHLYQTIIDFYLDGMKKSPSSSPHMTKDHLGQLLSLAQTDRERECIKYAVFKTSGLSASAARKFYGFSDMTQRADRVERAIEEAQCIRENIQNLAAIQDKAILLSHGISLPSSSSSSDSEESVNSDDDSTPVGLEYFKVSDTTPSFKAVDFTTLPLKVMVEKSKSNFFQVAEEVEAHFETSLKSEELDILFQEISSLPAACYDSFLMNQSYRAFLVSAQSFTEEQRADLVNGLVITDSESENPELWSQAAEVETEKRKLVQKQRMILQRRIRRQRAKHIATANFLSRKVSKKARGIVKKFPNIGKAIEDFVSERNVGADFWRRTGVLTFDGNRKVKQKVTYERIRQHLQKLYDHPFSYGTVVQLCVARNKRRKSAANYRGLARVTTRRARKGFTLRFNPDSHWSAALYRSLNWLQYRDGHNILNINRDDASGYRLDTLATNNQYATPTVGETLTTRTDYVNKYSSVLQTTSYNFTGSNTTGEMCAGVVKPAKVYPKNPAQHAADFKKLASVPELKPAFTNHSTGLPKRLACIRVDGAGDEGPGHVEVQYWWTLHHMEAYTEATLVTSKSSGSSYLNGVELQNGCLSLAHANLFIPSTLNGSCCSGSDIDKEKLTQNLMSAAEVYIQRCNNAPCGDTEIHLYLGADSSELQNRRERLLKFLKGSQKEKVKLQREHPEEYSSFERVWSVRERHMVKDVPPQYVFFLLPCYEPECPHPACEKGKPEHEPTWFEDGPPISYLPFPVPDTKKPWGSEGCDSCTGFCSGHYLKPEEAYLQRSRCISEPPSQILLKLHKSVRGSVPEQALLAKAKEVQLSVSDIKFWMQHLDTIRENRKKGAQKALETRRKKKGACKRNVQQISEWRCGVCDRLYEDETEEEEVWIECSQCQLWYHVGCVHLTDIPDEYFCPSCEDRPLS